MNAQVTGPAFSSQRLVLLGLLLLAFALRCAGLDAQELRGDEAFGYFFSLPSLQTIVERTIELSEPHPVASYWLQHFWLGVAGHSEFALRFVGAWWSVLAVALIWPLALRLSLGRGVALVGVLLMALSPYVIWHAQDARMYNMSLALTMASTLFALRWWLLAEGTLRKWGVLGYVLAAWLALNTHYFAAYVIVALNVALVGWAVLDRTWRKLLIWWAINTLVLLLWAVWLAKAWSIFFAYHGNGDSPSLVDGVVRALSAFVVAETATSMQQGWWAGLALLLIVLGSYFLAVKGDEARKSLWFLAMYALIPLGATWLSAQSRPIFNERYLVAAVPPVYLLMAAAISPTLHGNLRSWLRWLGVGLVGVIVAGMLVGSWRQANDPQFSKTRGWRELAMTLTRLSADVEPSKVRFAQNYPDPTLWYYYQGDVARIALPPAPNDAARAADEVARLVADGVGRVILIEQPAATWDGSGIARAALAADYALGHELTVARWPLSIWARPVVDLVETQVAYVRGLQLQRALVMPAVASAGSLVEVHLAWDGLAGNVSETEAVSLQLLDGAGQLVAQQDRAFSVTSGAVSSNIASNTTALMESYAILLPTTLAAGEYQLVVVVYDAGVEGTPRRLTVDGQDHYLLTTVRIAPLQVR